MLIICKETPTTSRRCFSHDELRLVLSAVVGKSISFYVEPEPDDMWLIMVNVDVGHVLDKCFEGLPITETRT